MQPMKETVNTDNIIIYITELSRIRGSNKNLAENGAKHDALVNCLHPCNVLQATKLCTECYTPETKVCRKCKSLCPAICCSQHAQYSGQITTVKMNVDHNKHLMFRITSSP